MANLFVGSGGFTTIQDAVNAASAGDTILISNGTYAEQVVVDGKDNLTFIGETRDGVIITAPSTIVQTGTDNGDPAGSPNNLDFGLFNILNGADNIHISNVTIDGADRGFDVTNGTDTKYVGLLVLNSTGTVVNNIHVTHVDDTSVNPTQNTFGILVDLGRTYNSTAGTFSLTGSVIDGIGKTGLLMYDTDATVTGNTIVGDGPTGQTAQNGIQISGSGTISNNTISDLAYTGADSASGILIISNQGIVVAGNVLNSVQVGIAGVFDFLTSTLDLSSNTVSNADPASLGAFVGFLTPTVDDLTIIGTDAVDQLNGSDGDDTIDGRGGADAMGDIDGMGSLGNDIYVVDNPGDQVFENAASGTDTVQTNLAVYSLESTANVENLTGTSSAGQSLTGNALANVITGGSGNDVLEGLGGGDVLNGGDGNDTASYEHAAAAVRVNLSTFGALGDAAGDTYISIENVKGSAFNDSITGDDNANILDGGAGDDAINGGAGDDTLLGGAGDDQLGGGSGNDTIVGGVGNDAIFGEEGNNQLSGGDGNDVLVSGAGNDIIGGDAGNDRINAGSGDDVIFGGAGDDELGGGAGNDIIVGDAGEDALFGEAGDDKMNGGDSNDIVLGGDGNDEVGGGAGSDYVSGGAGDDTVFGESGSDVLDGGTGNDILVGGSGDDLFVFRGGDGADLIVDFTAGGAEDRMLLIDTGLHSFADVQAASSFDAVTGTTVITYDGGAITVVGAGHLVADDFLFA